MRHYFLSFPIGSIGVPEPELFITPGNSFNQSGKGDDDFYKYRTFLYQTPLPECLINSRSASLIDFDSISIDSFAILNAA